MLSEHVERSLTQTNKQTNQFESMSDNIERQPLVSSSNMLYLTPSYVVCPKTTTKDDWNVLLKKLSPPSPPRPRNGRTKSSIVSDDDENVPSSTPRTPPRNPPASPTGHRRDHGRHEHTVHLKLYIPLLGDLEVAVSTLEGREQEQQQDHIQDQQQQQQNGQGMRRRRTRTSQETPVLGVKLPKRRRLQDEYDRHNLRLNLNLDLMHEDEQRHPQEHEER